MPCPARSRLTRSPVRLNRTRLTTGRTPSPEEKTERDRTEENAQEGEPGRDLFQELARGQALDVAFLPDDGVVANRGACNAPPADRLLAAGPFQLADVSRPQPPDSQDQTGSR